MKKGIPHDQLSVLSTMRNSQAIQRRLQWLDDRLYWIGELNRADLTQSFEISPQQATSDIALYQRFAPANLEYDRSKKQYGRAKAFVPLFEKNPGGWLSRNAAENAGLRSIGMSSVKPLKRVISTEMIQVLSKAFRLRTPLSVVYQSMKSAEPEFRVICPHSIVETEIRWHVRAWIANQNKFADLIPGRILKVEVSNHDEWVSGDSDIAWNNWIEIILVPSSKLSDNQRHVVELDYQLSSGKKVLAVRECLVYYQLSAMYLVEAIRDHQGDPVDHNFGLAVENWQALQKYL